MYSSNPNFFSFLVISRHYGVNGADPKKIDTKSLIFDFDIFQQMTDPSFITNLKEKTDSFLKKLIEHRETGKKHLEHSMELNIITYFFVDMTSSTARCENTSSTVAVINTCDSNIKILLTLEVRNLKIHAR